MTQIMSEKIIQSPLLNELRNRNKELRFAIRTILDEWYYLEYIVRPQLLSQYDSLFGELEIGIQIKTLKAAELARRVELLSIKKDRGEILTQELISLVNLFVDKEFDQYHKRIHEVYKSTEDKQQIHSTKEQNNPINAELPKLYRAIVKKLHPDITTQSSDFLKYWQSAQDAYENKNLQKIRSLYLLICNENEQNSQNTYVDSISEEIKLQNEIKVLEIQLEREARKLSRLKSEEPFSIEKNLQNPQWVETHRHTLNNDLFKKCAEIKQYQLLMTELTGNEWQQSKGNTTLREQNFDQEFTNSTYFSGR